MEVVNETKARKPRAKVLLSGKAFIWGKNRKWRIFDDGRMQMMCDSGWGVVYFHDPIFYLAIWTAVVKALAEKVQS